MRRSRTASRPESLVCPLCGSGELSLVGHDSARCASCSDFVQGWTLEYLGQVAAFRTPWAVMPTSVVTPRCASYQTGRFTALSVTRKCSPSILHSPPDRRPQPGGRNFE